MIDRSTIQSFNRSILHFAFISDHHFHEGRELGDGLCEVDEHLDAFVAALLELGESATRSTFARSPEKSASE